MNLLRNILTAVWCAVIIGTNVFGLIIVLQTFGMDAFARADVSLPVLQMAGMTVFGVMSLASTKFLWAILSLAALSLLLGFGYEVMVQRVWRPTGMLGGLFVIIPTYLLARWNSLSRHTDFNPVQEF